MDAEALLRHLRGQISEAEWALLQDPGAPLVISRWNHETLLRLRDWPKARGEASWARLERMDALLGDYLNRFMADRPEAHKWIRLSCEFLAFIAREPLHPQPIVRRRAVARDGRTVWLCPAREEGADSLCGFCVCEKDCGTDE